MSSIKARDLGLDFSGVTGVTNSLVDVPGVLVGMKTLIEGDGPLITGKGPIRTGVTGILPRGRERIPHRVLAGMYALNGNGEMTGSHWIRDAGYLVGPICLTNTHSVGMVHHGATRWMIEQYKEQWEQEHLWAMPVVAETYDGVLNDINGQHITQQDTLDALKNASASAIEQGNVGGGTGMICYGFKGGTGSSSRQVFVDNENYIMGALVQANHGIREWFTPLGVPVGRMIKEDCVTDGDKERGSIIVILGTNIPLLPGQLERIARRAALGIGRGGTLGGNNSGDIFLAFSTANSKPVVPDYDTDSNRKLQFECIDDDHLDTVYLNVVEAVEEAVINAMVSAQDMTTLRPADQVCRAIDHAQFLEIMSRHGRRC